jgi:AcrR family transcriptional regulator
MAAKRVQTRRRQPLQARSRSTVDAILLAAARVFRREGWRATTNRIAAEAGVSVGSLYEYFPDKQALLLALAVRHLELAEQGLAPLLGSLPPGAPLRPWLAAVQAAVLASQQFPSQALELLAGGARSQLAARAAQLRESVLGCLQQQLEQRGHTPAAASLRAQAALGAIGELTVLAWLRQGQQPSPLFTELLQMAARHCEAPLDGAPA